MNADDFARDVFVRLTDPGSVTDEPMTMDEVRALTSGDIEALQAAEFGAWVAMVEENIDTYRQWADAKRQENANYEARLAAGKEYPGVADSLRWHIQRNQSEIAMFEVMVDADAEEAFNQLIDTPAGQEAWQHWRRARCTTDTPTARYYYNRIADPIFHWMHLTGRGKHAPFEALWPGG